MPPIPIRRAILSTSDKTGLVELARGLIRHGVELISTGGTHRALVAADVPVVEISDHTGFPEMLDGRVKTLHPKVHGGILYRRDAPEHLAAITAHGIAPIDLVVVNLYPFERTVAREGVSLGEAIEQIDIGGPSMIRSAAKNHAHVAVLTDPSQYERFVAELDRTEGALCDESRTALAVAAFARTADYDRAIHAYLETATSDESAEEDRDLPPRVRTDYRRTAILRYGENPHQKAAVYVDTNDQTASAVRAECLHGKALSYNNLLDLDAALSMARDFDAPAAIVVKHNNPCGAAVADEPVAAFRKAYEGDPQSAFGSVLGFNRPLDEATAEAIAEPGRFVEAIIAPDFSEAAFEILTTRPSWKNSVRLMRAGALDAGERGGAMSMRPIEGGMLRQSADLGDDGFEQGQPVTDKAVTEQQLRDLAFAWRMVKHVRSNAIVLVDDAALIGVGAGQMSRVDAVEIAIRKAGERSQGAVLASDAFFPFRDNVDRASEAGIVAIVQPGGSKRDQESIDACNEHGIAMLFTGQRHFRH